ncbi:MAG: leucine-rich repeat domain-containing protein [Oscillospiraceae bacterium]|jgi:Leucine-rich repeat (LRR) protein
METNKRVERLNEEGTKQLSNFMAANAAALKGRKRDFMKEITIQNNKYSTSLKKLDLSCTELTDSDIDSLKYMVNLTWLDLYHNKITDITPLKGLTKLTYLCLSSNNITDITSLKGLTNLTYLDLGYNDVTDDGIKALQLALPSCNIYS